jgi:hypothetical protein
MVNYANILGSRLHLVWGSDGHKGMKRKAVVWHPIDFYDGIKQGNKTKAKKGTNAGAKHATRDALSKTLRTRVVSGPELNLLLLGIPFFIDCAVSTHAVNKEAAKAARAKMAKKMAPRVPPPTIPTPVSLQTPPPPPDIPTPDEEKEASIFHHVRDDLIEAGVSEEAAAKFVMATPGNDLADDIDLQDLANIIECLSSKMDDDTLLKFQQALKAQELEALNKKRASAL